MVSRLRTPGGILLGLLISISFGVAAASERFEGDWRPRSGAVTNHVVVVSIDGLRPDAIGRYGLRTLRRLVAEGAYDSAAQTVLPSKTLPSHVSMLTGVPPEQHGITWNDDRSEREGTVSVPTVFELAKAQGFTTAGFFSKPKFRHLQKAGTLDYSQAPSGSEMWMATRTMGDAITYLRSRRPNLLFVHITEPDFAGHTVGWMSFAYGWAARRADGAVTKLLEAADETYGRGHYTLIVTADHGGHDRAHGSADLRDTTIPWLAWGEGVEPAQLPSALVRTTDTAATVLWLLGVPQPEGWTGTAVTAAFTPAAQRVAHRRVPE